MHISICYFSMNHVYKIEFRQSVDIKSITYDT